MNQREQLASENGMAIEFVNWFFDNKKDGCGNAWFMMMAAMWEGWTAREAQVKQLSAERDAVVAENAALKAAFSPMEIPTGATDVFSDTAILKIDGDEFHSSQWVDNETDVIRAVLDFFKPETPATYAYAASLRAEGVEMAIEAVKPLIAIEFQYSDFDACVSATYKFPESDLVGKVEMVEWMQDFATQLRSKSEVQHD